MLATRLPAPGCRAPSGTRRIRLQGEWLALGPVASLQWSWALQGSQQCAGLGATILSQPLGLAWETFSRAMCSNDVYAVCADDKGMLIFTCCPQTLIPWHSRTTVSTDCSISFSSKNITWLTLAICCLRSFSFEKK